MNISFQYTICPRFFNFLNRSHNHFSFQLSSWHPLSSLYLSWFISLPSLLKDTYKNLNRCDGCISHLSNHVVYFISSAATNLWWLNFIDFNNFSQALSFLRAFVVYNLWLLHFRLKSFLLLFQCIKFTLISCANSSSSSVLFPLLLHALYIWKRPLPAKLSYDIPSEKSLLLLLHPLFRAGALFL